MVYIHDSQNYTSIALEHYGLYDGLVYTTRQESVGWARITHIGNDEYEGVFTTDLGMYHLKAISVYDKSRRENDVVLLSPDARHENFRHSTHILIKDRDSYLNQFSSGDDALSSLFAEQKNIEESGSPVFQINQCGVTNNFASKNKTQITLSDSFSNLNLFKRAPANCPNSKKYVSMAAAADCSYYAKYQDAQKVLSLILSDWLAASKVYEQTFNVILTLSKLDILQTCATDLSTPLNRWNQLCSNGYTIQDRLSDFSYWRGQQNDKFALWHLMTNCPTQPSVGIAWVKTLCQRSAQQQGNEFTSGVGVSSIVPVEWKVVAHEIGHNFGAMHDCISSTCPAQCSAANPSQCSFSDACRPCSPGCDCKGQYIMNPLDTSTSDMFSTFSIADICLEIQDKAGTADCLLDSIPASIGAGICGNGVKEGNEECDCGSNCARSSCCTAECKLKAGSVCADENDSCCSGCKLLGKSSKCRPENGFCDPAEFCDGVNAACPKNNYLTDGTSCQTSSGLTAQCASGQCTSRDLQCTGRGLINTVKACGSFYLECRLYCQDSKDNCLQFNGNFIDGTPCGDTGKCSAGVCTGLSEVGEIIGWIKRNLSLSIPIIIVVGGGILMIIWAGISRCVNRSRSRARRNERASHLPLAPTNFQGDNCRRSQYIPDAPDKPLAFPDAAPTYESEQLQTNRNTFTAGNFSGPQQGAASWTGLQPFGINQAPANTEYSSLGTAPARTDWSGLEWIDDGTSKPPKY